MRLHRVEVTDWDTIRPAKYNRWQRLAARTQGLVTPANIITTVGGLLVIYSLVALAHGQYWSAIIALILGRLADIADGAVAEATKTKSTLGEAFDAVVDKIALGLAMIVLLSLGFIPLFIGAYMALQGVYNSFLLSVAKQRNYKIHPSPAGKVGAFLQWISIGLYVTATALNQSSANLVRLLGLVVFGVFVCLSIWASLNYSRQFHHKATARG